MAGGERPTQTDVATFILDEGNVATDDDATGTVTGSPLVLFETAPDPSSRREPGEAFTFTVRMTNTGPEPQTTTDPDDDMHGKIASRPGPTRGGAPALRGPLGAPHDHRHPADAEERLC